LDTIRLSTVCRLSRVLKRPSIFRHIHKIGLWVIDGRGRESISAIIAQDKHAIACAGLVNGLWLCWFQEGHMNWCRLAIPLFTIVHYLQMRSLGIDIDFINVLCLLKTIWCLNIAISTIMELVIVGSYQKILRPSERREYNSRVRITMSRGPLFLVEAPDAMSQTRNTLFYVPKRRRSL
jgi:hypothetical protein